MFVTFIVPAPQGCNLRCPGCAIAQRGEDEIQVLRHEDYLAFLRDLLIHQKVDRVGIQGHEALLPEAWPTTRALLKIAAASFAETSLITNGTFLPEHASELAGLLDTVSVSLNSATAEYHDRTRGVEGAFGQALRGLESAVAHFPARCVTVNTVLHPGKAHYLEGMAELLARIGIRQWSISPFVSFKAGRPVGDHGFIRDTTLRFAEEGQRYGITVSLSDELRSLMPDEFESVRMETLRSGAGFIRLSPDASCARGAEALTHASRSPKWDPKEPAHIFVEKIMAEFGTPVRRKRLPWLTRALIRVATR